MKYFCVTETIALYIQKYVPYRKRKVFFGETGKVDDLVPMMVKHKNEKYLVPMSDVHNDSLTILLDSKKLQHLADDEMFALTFAWQTSFFPFRTDKIENWGNWKSWGVINSETWFRITAK